MPRLRRWESFWIDSQPFPGFPVELGGFGKLHAPFLTESGLVRRCVAGNPGSGLDKPSSDADSQALTDLRVCAAHSLKDCLATRHATVYAGSGAVRPIFRRIFRYPT